MNADTGGVAREARQVVWQACAEAVLSNHGGRVLDASGATIYALPRVVEAVKKRITVIVDSGFRRGSDVVKALALGADAVMVGRAPLHGTASAGEAGARRALEIYREEIDRVLALIGCTSVADLNRDFVEIEIPRKVTDTS